MAPLCIVAVLLFIILFLHQTTTNNVGCYAIVLLFIILFLHQTTTLSPTSHQGLGCLSSCSYIKPQLVVAPHTSKLVVYHLVPTSNHNQHTFVGFVVLVVYHLVPTSNHNLFTICCLAAWLFIILFLHQTTTEYLCGPLPLCCLSSCSYIKPQRPLCLRSTHVRCLSSCSYIKPQPIAANLLVISKILRFWLLRNGRAGRFLLQIY